VKYQFSGQQRHLNREYENYWRKTMQKGSGLIFLLFAAVRNFSQTLC